MSTKIISRFIAFLKPTILFLLVSPISNCFAQTQPPFIFRQQERYVSKKIHRYLKTDTVIETSGAKIHLYGSFNSNKPYLLLLHGMGANAASNWFKQVQQLSKHYNLVMPDLIYFGGSTSNVNDYSPEFQATQIHLVLERLNVTGPINVMGFSYGGLVAAAYNQLFPDQVAKLIIIDGPVKYFSGQMADSCARALGAADITALLAPQTIKDFKSLQKAALSRNLPITKGLKKKIIAHFFAPFVEIRKKQIGYLFANEARYQNYNYNIDITPTLLVWGAKDGVVPLSVGESLQAAFRNTTQLLVYKKAKHDAQFRYSKALNRAVLEFLKSK